MHRRNPIIIVGTVVLLLIIGSALLLAALNSSEIGVPSVIFGVMFLIGTLMLVAGRLRLLGGLEITGWRARIMGLFWVLPLLTSYALPAVQNDALRDLGPQIMTVEVFLAVVVAMIVVALTVGAAEQETPNADTWWRN